MNNKTTKSNVPEMSVGEIAGKLKKVVEDNFGYVRIRGEISGYRGPHTSGHSYFSLKDEKARLEAIIWRGQASKLKHKPEEGLEVVAMGKLTTYAGSSKYQIIIEQMEPAGAGALMAVLEERKQKLQKEGLFDDEHKQELPFLPRTIAVITSPTGAVIHDIQHRIRERFPLHIMVWPARMQGETCAEEVSNAIKQLNNIKAGDKISRPDVIIIARGGGSLEDLWEFNDEKMVREAGKSQIPIISAVGHETDWTLLDYVADERAPTPTAAAEMATEIKEDLQEEIKDLITRHRAALERMLERCKTNAKASMRGLASPDTFLAVPRQKFDESATRLVRALDNITQRYKDRMKTVRLNPNTLKRTTDLCRTKMENFGKNLKGTMDTKIKMQRQKMRYNEKLLNTLSYKNVLARGYAIVRDANKTPIIKAKNINTGDRINVEMQDGNIHSVVDDRSVR